MKICYKVPKCYEDQEIYKILVREFRMSGVMIKRLKFHGTVNLNGIHATVREHVHEGDELYLEYGDSEFSLNRIDSIPIMYEVSLPTLSTAISTTLSCHCCQTARCTPS